MSPILDHHLRNIAGEDIVFDDQDDGHDQLFLPRARRGFWPKALFSDFKWSRGSVCSNGSGPLYLVECR
jgi:hypothetical protein